MDWEARNYTIFAEGCQPARESPGRGPGNALIEVAHHSQHDVRFLDHDTIGSHAVAVACLDQHMITGLKLNTRHGRREDRRSVAIRAAVDGVGDDVSAFTADPLPGVNRAPHVTEL